jgi:hypothetical protein
VSDIPAALFVEELMDAYPEAKIVLTIREEEKWMASMEENIWGGYFNGKKLSPVATLMRDYIGPLIQFRQGWQNSEPTMSSS